jgi:hypothetical protein
MARANQPDRNLRNEVQNQIDDLNEDTSLAYDADLEAQTGLQQTGTAQTGTGQPGAAQTAMRTKATPKTSMQNKKGNQASGR